MRYQFIYDNSHYFRVYVMCDVLKVSKSGYYAWKGRPISQRESANQQLLEKIKQVFQNSKKRYGFRRVHRQLNQDLFICGKNRVARLMRQNALFSIVKKRFKATTNSTHAFPVADNILARKFSVHAPNTHWVGDISYIWTKAGWLYLATVMDLYSRAMVGWSLKDTLKSSLVEDAFLKAIWSRKPAKGLLFHSDRGSQYASDSFQKLLNIYHVTPSMSRPGNCWDNAVAESFFKTLKSELIYHCQYATKEEARRSIFEYIETFYNRKRLHSSIGYAAPMQFENAA